MHKRGISNPQKLLLQIENKEYYETNAAWSNRESIPSAPGLFARVVHPSVDTTDVYGLFIVRYIYAFSSRHEVGEEVTHVDIEDPAVWDKQSCATEVQKSV